MAVFNNQATLSYNGMILSSNVATGQLLEEISVTKTAVSPTYTQGDDVTYVINIVNTGTTAYTGLTLTDDLGGYTAGAGTVYPLTYIPGTVQYYVNGALRPAPTVTAGPPMSIAGVDVPAGGNATVIYAAQVNSVAPPTAGGTVTNTVSVDGGNLAEALTDSADISTVNIPVLTIAKSVNPTVVTENSRVTYTFVIQNTGNTPAGAGDGVIVSDVFDPLLNNISVTFNGAAWAPGTDYTYDTATGVFSTNAGQVTVPAATYNQDNANGAFSLTPGVSTLVVSGTV